MKGVRTIKKEKTFFEFKALSNKKAELYIQGEITPYAYEEFGEMSATAFKAKLEELGDVEQIDLYTNSPGGSVFDGLTIANMLKRHKARVVAHVDGLAASIASVIVASADEVVMPSNAMMMIHNPLVGIVGNAKEMREQADILDKVTDSLVETYMAKVGDKTTEENIRTLMDAETWLSAKEAVELGLADVIEAPNKMVASISEDYKNKFKNIPKALLEVDKEPQANVLTDAERQEILSNSKANIAYLQTLNLL